MAEYLTVKMVSKRLGITEDTVRSYITKGVKGIKLVAIELPRGYRIQESDLEEFLNKLKTQGEEK
jgi:excisionase family DNA binding protein